jgi:PEP-CTERM motif
MRFSKLATLVALSALLLSVPLFADTFTVFNNPTDGVYIPSTTDYGGGDGSGGTINSLGTFNFSSGLLEFAVGVSWATWNCPPATESCTPNVLYTNGATTLTLTMDPAHHDNTAGFELEPDQFQQEIVTALYHYNDGATFFLGQDPNGSAGALLYAVQNDTPGTWVTSIDIVDTFPDDFAIAQLRQGNSGTVTPEPGTMALLGTGLLGALGAMRRKMNL